jgi:hypothetical protein
MSEALKSEKKAIEDRIKAAEGAEKELLTRQYAERLEDLNELLADAKSKPAKT